LELSFQGLLRKALTDEDVPIAAACHPRAGSIEKNALEAVLFVSSQSKRHLSRAPRTPATVLHRLAVDGDELVRRAVARNPSTTGESLATLAMSEESIPVVVGIAGHPDAPASVLADVYSRFSESPPVRRALCRNPRTPGLALSKMVRNASMIECKLIAANPSADKESLKKFWGMGDCYLQAEVAAHPHCSSDLIDLASCSTEALVRRKVAENPNVSDLQLKNLLDDPAAPVRAAAVRHVTNLDVGHASFEDTSRLVRRDQARHRSLPEERLNTLATDTDTWVRQLVARNETTPQRTLDLLANDPVTDVRRSVSRNLMCRPPLLIHLGRDSHPWVRAGVALRSDLPEFLMDELAETDDEGVLSALGRNSMVSPQFLERLIEHQSQDVRRAVILNRRAPRRLLRKLLIDPYPVNRAVLGRHENLSLPDLSHLLGDPAPEVRFSGASSLVARLPQ